MRIYGSRYISNETGDGIIDLVLVDEKELSEKDKQIEAMKNCINCGSKEPRYHDGADCIRKNGCENYGNWIPKPTTDKAVEG